MNKEIKVCAFDKQRLCNDTCSAYVGERTEKWTGGFISHKGDVIIYEPKTIPPECKRMR